MRESLVAVDRWMISKCAVDHNGLVLAESGAETRADQIRGGFRARSRRLGQGLRARHRGAILQDQRQSARFLKRVGGNLDSKVERARRGGVESRLCVVFDIREVDEPHELHVPIELMHL